jgi:hypothetical protein
MLRTLLSIRQFEDIPWQSSNVCYTIYEAYKILICFLSDLDVVYGLLLGHASRVGLH